MIKRAKEIIEELTKDIEIGKVYSGKVKRIEKFGAFIEIAKGKDGLAHISELANERVAQVEDVLSMGQVLDVKVVEIDKQGRINLSVKALLKKED